MDKLREKISRLRKNKRITQAELAELAGISRVSYTYFENGTTDKLSLDAAIGIAKALGVSFNELYEIEDINNEARKLKSENEALKEKIAGLEELKKMADTLYGSSAELKHIGTMELERLKEIFTLADIFQFIDKSKFAKDFNHLINEESTKELFTLDVIIRFYALHSEESKLYLIDYIDFDALNKSPDLLKTAKFILNSEKWDKKKIIADLLEIKEIDNLLD